MILFWDWRFSLIGLVVVQSGVAAVAINTGQVQTNLMIVQVCIIALCALILALSSAKSPPSPSIRQSGNGMMRLLTLILLYTALRLFDFDFMLPLPEGIEAGQGIQITVFFIWLSICALLTLSLSNNPLFTGVALLLWCVPAHLLASLLIPTPGISVLVGIIELLLALGCSYLILTESFSTDRRPIVATDITFPVEGRRMLPDNRMVPIGEMTTMDIPAVPVTPQARQAIIGTNLPNTAPRGTVLAETQHVAHVKPVKEERANRPQANQPPTTNRPQTNRPQTNRPQTNRPQTNQPHTNRPQTNQPENGRSQPNRPQEQTPQAKRRGNTGTPLTRTNLKAVQNRSPVPPTQPAQNYLDNDVIEPTQPTPNLFVPREPSQPTEPKTTQPASKPDTDQTQTPKAEKPFMSRIFKRTPTVDPDTLPDKHEDT